MDVKIEIENERIHITITHNGYQWHSLNVGSVDNLYKIKHRINKFLEEVLEGKVNDLLP